MNGSWQVWKLSCGQLFLTCCSHLLPDEHSWWFSCTGSVAHISETAEHAPAGVPQESTLFWATLIYVGVGCFVCVRQEVNPEILSFFVSVRQRMWSGPNFSYILLNYTPTLNPMRMLREIPSSLQPLFPDPLPPSEFPEILVARWDSTSVEESKLKGENGCEERKWKYRKRRTHSSVITGWVSLVMCSRWGPTSATRWQQQTSTTMGEWLEEQMMQKHGQRWWNDEVN